MASHKSPQLSPSPPLQPLSKRDKRRQTLTDRLNDMMNTFTRQRDQHYRAQLQAIQTDIHLITEINPYDNVPLPDDPEELAEQVKKVTDQSSLAYVPLSPSAQADYDAEAGKVYSQFVGEVNTALENKDAQLTMLWNQHQNKLEELNQIHQFKVYLAREEHRQLKNTIRERLIATVAHKKAKLMREKEQLDIADSNALLLHPNQYSITNPASPGGTAQQRKTRHLRHRAGDPDDSGEPWNKKRKRAYNDDENTSPAPAGRGIDLGGASPFREAKSKLLQTQFGEPLYSIERLFTEKELGLTMNQAHIATSNFFAKLKAQNPSAANARTNGNTLHSGDVDDGAPAEANAGGPPNNLDGTTDGVTTMDTLADTTAIAAPEMERTTSREPTHATRHATRTAQASNLHALSDLAALASTSADPRTAAYNSVTSGSLLPYPAFPSTQPIVLPVTKANAQAPPPPALPNSDAEQDLLLMHAGPSNTEKHDKDRDAAASLSLGLGAGGIEALNDRLLERACAGSAVARGIEYKVPGLVLQGDSTAAVPDSNGIAFGGVPMSAQSSMAGMSEMGAIGGVPMSRFGGGSSLGGVDMRRTASGRGARSRA